MPMPSRAQLPDDLEQLLRLARGQRRRRLVHDDDARVEGQRLGDLDHLHLPDGQASRPACRAACCRPTRSQQRRGRARAWRRRRSGLSEPAACASSLPRKMLAAMSRFGASISSWWMSAMPACLRVAHGLEAHGAPVDQDLALVGRVARRPGSSSACSCRRRSRPSAPAPRRARACSDTSWSATTPGKRLVMPRISSSGGAAGAGLAMRSAGAATSSSRRAASRSRRRCPCR